MIAALYIHFPFCLKKCAYCDFYSIADHQPQLIEQYMKAMQQEIKLQAQQQEIQELVFGTVYIGGGTPSLLLEKQVEALLNFLRQQFHLQKEIEFTLEVNPETVDAGKLAKFRDAGINRLSIGVQSFDDRELQLLGRIHDARRASTCLQQAVAAGFDNINIDLIFGIPGQSLQDWKRNLERAVAISPQHISMYGLTFEPHTPLQQQLKRGLVRKIPEAIEREMYVAGIRFLQGNGFQHYEISNLAKPGYHSRHNQSYWEGRPYLGIGAAAHSFWNQQRQWNVANVRKFMQTLSNNQLPIADSEILTTEQQMLEFILLQLRQAHGIELQLFEQKFKTPFVKKYQKQLADLSAINNGALIKLDQARFQLTIDGMLLYNEICACF